MEERGEWEGDSISLCGSLSLSLPLSLPLSLSLLVCLSLSLGVSLYGGVSGLTLAIFPAMSALALSPPLLSPHAPQPLRGHAGPKLCAFWAVIWACGCVCGCIGVGCMFVCECAVFYERQRGSERARERERERERERQTLGGREGGRVRTLFRKVTP